MTSRGLYSRFFAAIYDPFMEKIEERILSRHRQELLGGLKGFVLEIGSGTGVNFSYYRTGDVTKVMAVEPNDHSSKRALAKLAVLPDKPTVTIISGGIEDEEAARAIPTGKVDAVVCTLVLCTIPDPQGFLRKVQGWLRPGGQLILLEHVRSHNSVEGFFHDLFTPVWRKVADGCHLNRQTDLMMGGLPFVLREEQHFHFALPFYRAVYEKQSGMRSEMPSSQATLTRA